MGISKKHTIKSNKRFNKSNKNFKQRDKFRTDTKKVELDNQDSEMSSSSQSDAEEYEKKPRFRKQVLVRNLLPLKNKKGLIYRSEVVKEDEDEENYENITSEEPKSEVDEKQSLVYKYAAQRQLLEDLKCKVALLCTSVIGDPESNMKALRELVSMLINPTTQMIVSEKRVLCLSLLHVFLDILPGYRVRIQEEDGTKVKLKKETKKLITYEKTLLKQYKTYVDYLYELIRRMKFKRNEKKPSRAKQKALREVALIAIKCMCELLHTHFCFNYFKNIANKLVPLAVSKDKAINTMCCQAFQKLFKADKRGEASLDLVSQIVKVIKERKFCIPAVLLRTFLSLNLREAKPEVEKIDMNEGRKQWQKMSRTERKNKKKSKDLEAELKEAQAFECVENVRKFHTQTLNKIFWVYFHILKDAEKISLIAPALEGLSNFAYLINLEFYDDLNAVVCGLMESGILSNVEKLHGVYTLFTILAGQAESLHIDPHKIYCHMYQSLFHLNYRSELQHFSLILKCLEFNVLRKKKKISFNRILAFAKRVVTVCLQTPMHGTLGLLSTLRNMILNIKGLDILLDSESTIGSGIYYPEFEDPEYCNAQSTALWELHLLKKHYNPVVKMYSQHILHGCTNQGRLTLPDKLARSSPEDVLNLFAEVGIENKFDFLEETVKPPKKKFKYNSISDNFRFDNDINVNLNWTNLKSVDFLDCIKD